MTKRLLSKFLFQRFVICIITIFSIATVTFFLMHSVPGDPFIDEQGMPADALKVMRAYYGLDMPLIGQYFRYLKEIFCFDFGPSLKFQDQSVNEIIRQGFPISFSLGIEALFLAIPLGIAFGLILALKRTGPLHISLIASTAIGVSIPSFVLAALLQFLFAIYYPILPVARWGGLLHTILPALALAIGPICFIARLLQATILEVLTLPYIQTARAVGLPKFSILVHYVIKNAILPILGYIGPVTANLMVGSFVVERVFAIPGLGQWFVNGVISRDYPIIAALTIFYSMVLFGVHTILDLLSCAYNPHLRDKILSKG